MDEKFRGHNLRPDYVGDMLVIPKKISTGLNDGNGLNHLFFYVGGRRVFTRGVVPINCRGETVGIYAGIDQMADGSVPLRLAVRNSSFKIGDGKKHIARFAVSRFWMCSGKS